ncbi:MAG: small subunit ribosomal protein S1 [Myxococcota bacterium]|jgi:small subunit ribosomal protein S1
MTRTTRPRRGSPTTPVDEQAPAQPATPRPRTPVVPEAQVGGADDRPRLDLDDLEALAKMDPGELAALMDGQLDQKRIEPGTKITGTVTRVGRNHIFVDVGGKSEGALERDELPEANLGDKVEAFVLSADEMGIRLSLRLSGAAAAEHLDEAHASGEPIEGMVSSRNPGGFEVRVGGVRAFCPVSRMSRLPAIDMDVFVGQSLQFRVIETGDKIVLDRRVLQDEEAAVHAESLWATLAPGDQRSGTVRNVKDFGAFVDIGGVDGLVPRSEISWSRGADPREVLRPGQSVEVHVIEIDHDRKRITLSCKSADSDPWGEVGATFTTGGVFDGSVARVEPYGAFVELAPGVTGLLHASRFGGESPNPGDTIRVRVNSIDHERRRLELVLADSAETPAMPTGATVSGSVVQVMQNGVAITLDDGRSAWLPAREVDLPAGTVLAQRFRRGRKLEARVLESEGARVVVTLRDGTEDSDSAWRKHVNTRTSRSGAASSAGFGTLGDLLRGLKD